MYIDINIQILYNKAIIGEVRNKICSVGGENMSTTKAQQKAVNNYVRKNYERVLVTFKQKGKKESIKAHADAHKESVNGFINRAIDETMERDNDFFNNI